MKSYSYFLFILLFLNLARSKSLSGMTKRISVNLNSTVNSNNYPNNLRGSGYDVDMNGIYITLDYYGYAAYAEGTLRIYNTGSYLVSKCGFSNGEPSQSDIDGFAADYIRSSSSVTVGTYSDSDDYFSCFACDYSYCYGKYIKFKSSYVGVIVTVVIVVIIIICCCVCGCIAYNRRKNVTRNNNNVIVTRTPLQSNMNINTVANGIPVANNMSYINAQQQQQQVNGIPVTNNNNMNVVTGSNPIVYAVPNADGTYQYFVTANAIPTTTAAVATDPTFIPNGEQSDGTKVAMNNTSEPTFMPNQNN